MRRFEVTIALPNDVTVTFIVVAPDCDAAVDRIDERYAHRTILRLTILGADQ